ncbi:MAG TPA: hypothetical protein VFL57_13695, partial [Bryobacteraceae bacterium]|nr:hypothetical protein [Bryobacteraceae bacterium]
MTDMRKDQESGTRLESWKEIAAYLHRDVSTVRRWEKEEGLPVHRHEHRERSTVFAIPEELNAWRDSRRPEPQSSSAPSTVRRAIIAAALTLTLLTSGWALWRAGLFRLPYPLVEAAEPRSQTSLRKVWSGSDVYNVGAVSPDGRYLAAADRDSGDLIIREINTGATRRLTGGHLPWRQWTESFRFSSNNKLLAYNWANENAEYELRVLEVAQPQPRVIFRSRDVSHAVVSDWMRDGSQILVLAWRPDRTAVLALLPAAGGDLRVLKHFDERTPSYAALSPDGRLIGYDVPREIGSADRDIHIITVDGSLDYGVAEHPATDTFVGWTPSGDHILFVSDRSGRNDLWSVPVHEGKISGNPELLKRGIELTSAVGITKAGVLYYSVRPSEGDVYVVALDAVNGKARGVPRAASPSFPGTHSKPEWSPDGRKLAFISARSRLPYSQHTGSRRLRIRDLRSGEETEQHFDIPGLTTPRWSPDGKHLIVESHGSSGRAFYLVNLAGGKAQRLPVEREGSDPNMVVVWAPDGKSLLLGTRNIKERQAFILRRDLATGGE